MQSFFFEGQSGSPAHGKVLVVDTDLRALQRLSSVLRSEGFDVLEATSFAEGKRLWTEEGPAVLIVDIRLGQYNGLQLVMRAKADRPDLTAVITCPFLDVVLEAETRRLGGVFLVKPVDPSQIVATIRDSRAPRCHELLMPSMPSYTHQRMAERRQMVIPNFTPERRKAERRSLAVRH